MNKTSISPYPEFDQIVDYLKNDKNLWGDVLKEEKDTHDRLRKINNLSGEEKDEEVYRLESRPIGGIHNACLKAVNELRVEDQIGTIAQLTVAIRYHAAHDLGI